ncbi:hypothetical protein [Streptomyces sp. MNU103]|uniref:hypothetical protein n=1 Tax=Streptomyces sp. MNU103 TaxID=2560024 RepID=UPI001E5203BC|nr:hypothetical protein [Streptomyces sp. MNU103]
MRSTRCGRLRPDGGESAMNAAGERTDGFGSSGGRARTPGAAGALARPSRPAR